MARFWDQSTIEAILRAALPSVVAESLGIAVVRRSGTYPRALCPFHEDHDPSLVLYDKWESRPPHYHCFACGADGDVISLVKGVRQTNFVDSLQWLADYLHIPAPKASTTRSNRANQSVSTWDGNPELAFSTAREIYLVRNELDAIKSWLKKRKLPLRIAESAELALAQAGTLTQELERIFEQGKGGRLELEMLEQVGLIRAVRAPGDGEDLFASLVRRYRDFFADPRILFPVKNLEGKTVGFAGRIIGEASSGSPKYLYSPGLPKSTLLYRGDVALERLKAQSKLSAVADIYICEGIVDALRLESVGVAAVALLGASASKEQVAILKKMEEVLQSGSSLRVHIFLDRDRAGIRGAAKLAASLAESGMEATYIWPTDEDLESLQIPSQDRKDPDSILARVNSKLAEELLKAWMRPAALAVVTVKLGPEDTPNEVLNDSWWSSISLGTRYRIAANLSRDPQASIFLLDGASCKEEEKIRRWILDLKELRSADVVATGGNRLARSSIFIEELSARFNIARALAKSGAERGEVPSDEAAWRRIDAGATAFNIGLQERLSQGTFEPLEPFDAVWVARDFEKLEPRLKAMPCPEDLVLQQYMLAEVLTERFDASDDPNPFSSYVPAVRYYREMRKTETTAEDGTFERRNETLSFAYQIDMDVLEGRRGASNQGMFRPYIECWQDFISALRHKAQDFDEVFAIRLDVKRYYDRLTRTAVRDPLKSSLEQAFNRLSEQERFAEFAPDFQNGRLNLSDSITDWFCDQSFDYEFYEPTSGKISKTTQGVGIPQGPILSAWLATIALFPMDAALRNEIAKINAESETPGRVAYARYVDDIFLIAESADLLQRLRRVVEESSRRLRLEVAQKGDMAPRMSAAEFRELLTEGKALVGSGPTSEIGLLHLGDGEAGYDTWQEPVLRSSALVLLSDRNLYEVSVAVLEDQVFTALNAHDLRPNELPKASRWIWYAVASEKPKTVVAAWQSYWEKWGRLTRGISSKLSVENRPWNDPCICALDGLERILSSANVHDRRLPASAEKERKGRLFVLSKLVLAPGFFAGFLNPSASSPKGAGAGATQLRRMFIQRSVCVRWIARQLTGQPSEKPFEQELSDVLDVSASELLASLTRAWLTDSDGNTFSLKVRANDGASPYRPSPLRPLFVWFQEAVVLLGRTHKVDVEQLEAIGGSLLSLENKPRPDLVQSSLKDSKFYKLLNLWLADNPNSSSDDAALRVVALSALLAVCHIDGLTGCLSRRGHLLGGLGRVLPALPGIPAQFLILAAGANANGIAHLENIQQYYGVNVVPPKIDYFLSSKSFVHRLELNWTQSELDAVSKKMAGRRAAWSSLANLIFAVPPPRPEKFTRKELAWTADCFQLLAHLNFEVSEETSGQSVSENMALEFAPAWPYIAASILPQQITGDTPDAPLSLSLVGPAVSKGLLGNLAFARDGQGRLKSYEVELSYAGLWRIGFAVTDALGLAEELDRYRALDRDGDASDTDTARYVLGKMLRRLRGDFSWSGELLRHPEFNYLPATVYRALSILRGFPVTGSQGSELCYLLAVECESAAMQLRSSGYADGTKDGAPFGALAEVARLVFLRLPAIRLEALPALEISVEVKGQRRCVAAWNVLDRRLQLLEGIASEKLSELATQAWTALRYAVRAAAVTAWIRALVFELETEAQIPQVAEATVPTEWGLEDCLLVADGNGNDLYQAYHDALLPAGRLSELSNITPLGWLTLLVQRLKLYDVANARTYLSGPSAVDMPEKLTKLARLIATNSKTDEAVVAEWPFDALHCMKSALSDANFIQIEKTLSLLDDALGFRVELVQSDTWGISQGSNVFTDHKGKGWKLSRLLVEQLGRDRHIEQVDVGRGFTKFWTETRNSEGALVGVSALGLDFSRTVGLDARSGMTLSSATPVKLKEIEDVSPSLVKKFAFEKPVEGAPSVEETEIVGHFPVDSRPDLNAGSMGAVGSELASKEMPLALSKWAARQREEWRLRRNFKSDGHVRFALFQFRVDESYVHPLLDVGFPDDIEKAFGDTAQLAAERASLIAHMSMRDDELVVESKVPESLKEVGGAKHLDCQRARAAASVSGSESLWQESALLPSWKEHRRRRMLEAAISSCAAFNVDVLVLPEYCVRPDTVAWLKSHMEASGTKVSVLAGTYRLHGNRGDIHFTETFKDIFGLADEVEVFSSSGHSMEKSAYLTLLHPVEFRDQHMVTVFSRRKKYHSIAMKELINPPHVEWSPLLDFGGLIQQLDEQLKKKGKPKIDVGQVVQLARSLSPAERMSELVCSELFASTHPVNTYAIQQEYTALRIRFGDTRITKKDDSLTKDTLAFTSSLLHRTSVVDRRSIIVVPACTTRSADYWIYGQSAVLASGLTTVFCGAVFTDERPKGGGSCFIGKSSWDGHKNAPGTIPLITPYSGWSRGVYYNKPSDALGRQEQALVIADLDPVYMNEGKPRPQTLPVPISLVAHLPLIETVNLSLLSESFTLINGAPSREVPKPESKWGRALGLHDQNDLLKDFGDLEALLATQSPSQLLDPSTIVPGTAQSVAAVAERLKSFFADQSGWANRLESWRKNWREVPYYGIPPALLDFLHVDLSPSQRLDKVFVPPWGSNDSGDVLRPEADDGVSAT